MLLRIDKETKTVVMQMLKYEFSISSNYKYRKKKKWEGQKKIKSIYRKNTNL